jgi:hypothetical protein
MAKIAQKRDQACPEPSSLWRRALTKSPKWANMPGPVLCKKKGRKNPKNPQIARILHIGQRRQKMKHLILLNVFFLTFFLGCDADSADDSFSGSADISGSTDTEANSDSGTPEQEVEPHDQTDPDAPRPPLDHFRFLEENRWQFIEGGTYTGENIRQVTIEPPSPEYDEFLEDYDGVAIGLFPEGAIFPLKLESDGWIVVDKCNSIDSVCWKGQFREGDTEIELSYMVKDPYTEEFYLVYSDRYICL